jgi:hypothetical protein
MLAKIPHWASDRRGLVLRRIGRMLEAVRESPPKTGAELSASLAGYVLFSASHATWTSPLEGKYDKSRR